MAGLRPVLEPTGLITGSTQIRPADTLLIAPPSLKPNSWRKFPRLALDLAVTCPVTQPLIAQAAAETLSAAGKYADRKRGSGDIAMRCAAANLGYEPVVFESFGGIERGGMELLSSICSKVDQQQQSRIGEAKRLCLARLSFDL